ncbi:hypothetical protein KZ483_25905 [Paenibacillus sp. sptzw28]|uniref:hypothetical protein n=1 Tax=Paenibacillus sp. sptzw28 TaxID=715179 RepID=UPI001C6EEC70|nr:hypothetical protein [Paenibacillus sp. sptzw28]QYR21110.1 hypothetical protein KZ483_25905 [Paenibacillus sp. sptzw28]
MFERDMEHRKFFKSIQVEYEVGIFLPNEVLLLREGTPTDLSWLKDTMNGSILFFLSHYCEACDAEVVLEAIKKYPEFSYIIFFEGPVNPVSNYKQLLDERNVKLYSFHIDQIENSLKVQLIPYQLVLNKVGQVITAGIINTLPMIEDLMLPLLRVMENNK